MASEDLPRSGTSIEDVATGQRMIIYAILVNLAVIVLVLTLGDAARLLSIVAIVLAIVGLLRLTSGLGYSTGVRVLLVVLALIPLISLITLVMVNARATTALREAGYKVGLFGARKT